MACVIVKKSSVEKLGRELIKEVYDFLHDEDNLKDFPEFLETQKKFDKDITYLRFKKLNVTTTSSRGKLEKDKFEEELKTSVEQIKNGTMDFHIIFTILLETDLDSEVDEDLCLKKKSFLDIYKVFVNGYTYLED